MNEDTKIREAMSSLHASDDLYDQVMSRAGGARKTRRGHALSITAATCLGLAGTLVTAGVAGAIVTADPLFFIHAWSNHGQADEISWEVLDSNDEPIYTARRSYEGVDAEKVSDDIASAVEGVGLSCELFGYTLCIDSVVVDSNGCGAATYTLSKPDGVQYRALEDGLPNELILNHDAVNSDLVDDGVDGISMTLPHAEQRLAFCNTREYVDADTSTDTEVHGTIYFDSMGRIDQMLEGMRWGLSGHAGEGNASRQVDAHTDEFTPSKVVEAKRFSDEEGNLAHLSPFSLQIPVVGGSGVELVPNRVALHLVDGTEYVVEDDESGIFNRYMSTYPDEGNSITMVLTGLVDVGQVESITVEGSMDGTEVTRTLTTAS